MSTWLVVIALAVPTYLLIGLILKPLIYRSFEGMLLALRNYDSTNRKFRAFLQKNHKRVLREEVLSENDERAVVEQTFFEFDYKAETDEKLAIQILENQKLEKALSLVMSASPMKKVTLWPLAMLVFPIHLIASLAVKSEIENLERGIKDVENDIALENPENKNPD